MRYTIGAAVWAWAIVSFLGSLVVTAVVTTVMRATGIEIYGVKALIPLAGFFVVFFIAVFFCYKGLYIELAADRVIIGESRHSRKPPVELKVADIEFTELVSGNLWRIFPRHEKYQAPGKEQEENGPVRMPIDGYYLDAFGLPADEVRRFCRQHSIPCYESEFKYADIQDVEVARRKINFKYPAPSSYKGGKTVAIQGRDTLSIELVTHARHPADDHYIINLKDGSRLEFGYFFLSCSEVRKYAERNDVSFVVRGE